MWWASTSRLAVVFALVLGLGVGLGVAALLLRDGPAEPGVTTDPADVPQLADRQDLADLTAALPAPDPITGVAEATSPEAALRGFLAAEAAGEWEASYAFLTPEVQEVVHPSPAAWVNAHSDFPTVTGYRIDEVESDAGGTATAQTLTAYDATLDPVLGLVPPRGRTTWRLVQADDGTWRVDVQATVSTPIWADPATAGAVVRDWVNARIACEDTGELEAGLIGAPVLADRLCEDAQEGPVQVGDIRMLVDSSETAPLLSEFGPEVFGWARTATVEATTPFQVVLAPVGLEWKVVAVIRAL